MKKLFVCIIAFTVVLAMFSSCGAGNIRSTDKVKHELPKNDRLYGVQRSDAEASRNNTNIKIGLTCPYADSSSAYGIAVKNAAQLAVDEINSAGGLEGITFELVALNDSGCEKNVEELYEELWSYGIQVALGSATSECALEFSSFAEDDGMFVLTPTVMSDALLEFAATYQMCPSLSLQGRVVAEFFNKNFRGKSIGIFYQSDSEYSKTIYDEFKANLDAYFAVQEATFTISDVSYDSHVQLLKNCDVVFMPVYSNSAYTFMAQAKNICNDILTYVGCDGFYGIDGIELFDISSIEQEIFFFSHFDAKAVSGPAADFLASYSARYDEEKEPPNIFAASAYDSVYAIFEALKVAKLNGIEISANISPKDLCRVLETVFESESFVFRGITGECENGERACLTWDERRVKINTVKCVLKQGSD